MCREVGLSPSPLALVDGDWYFWRRPWRLEQFSAADTRGQSCAFFPLLIPRPQRCSRSNGDERHQGGSDSAPSCAGEHSPDASF